MWKFLAAAVGLVALGMTAPADAADVSPMPYARAQTYIPALYDWSGFYIGANGGYGANRSCWDLTTTTGTFLAHDGCHNATGAVAGGQFGYRTQFGGWVFGVEAQGDWANLRGSNAVGPTFTNTNRTSVDSFGLFTGQVGYAWNNALLYVKGGAAIIDNRYEVRTTLGNTLAGTTNDSGRWGATAGVGVEYGFAADWSAAIEYDRMFMQNRLTSFAPIPPSAVAVGPERIRQDIDVVTVRVNYRWGGPVIAKY